MRATYTPRFSDSLALQVPAGNVPGITGVNKFGRAPTGVQTTATDIWDRADATPTQSVWTAPTAARTHTIASSDADDTTGGAGARTVRVYGLTSWSADEVSEDVTMNTATPPVTANSYVIVHRMKVLTAGASATNEGTITATATTDSTVTAQINPSEGQTQMAIYGVPSTKVAYVSRYYGSVNKATGAVVEVNFSLVVNEDSATDVDLYIVKSTLGAQSTGSNSFIQSFDPYLRFPGPCILKMQGIASAADTEASAGFDLYLADA